MNLSTLLADAALFGGVTAAISLTARGFRLYNLACGAWVLIGGWLWCWATAPVASASVEPRWFSLVALAITLQVAFPWFLRRQLIHEQLAYVFATVGLALFLDGAIPALLLRFHSAVIGLQGSVTTDIASVAFSLAIIALSVVITSSSRYAKARVLFRLDGGHRNALLIAGLVLCEICLLMLLGAVSSTIHHGLFSSSFYRSIVPVLALLIARRRTLPAVWIAAGVPIVSYLVGKVFPTAAGVSMPLAIGLLGCVAVGTRALSSRRPGATGSGVLLQRPGLWGLRNHNLRALVALVALVLVLRTGFRLDAPASSQTAWMVTLAIAGMLVLGYLRVFTVSLPLIGSLGAYAVIILSKWPLALLAALAALGIGWIAYLALLRGMQQDYAVVTDLALMLGAGYLVMSSPSISGAEGVRLLGTTQGFPAVSSWVVVTLATGAIALLFMYASSVMPRVRTHTLGLLGGESGDQHGAPARLTRRTIAYLAAAVVIVGSFAYYTASGSIATASMSLERGLAVMVVASLMLRLEAAVGVLTVFGLFTVLAGATSGMGTLVYAGLGLGLVLVACLPSRQSTDG